MMLTGCHSYLGRPSDGRSCTCYLIWRSTTVMFGCSHRIAKVSRQSTLLPRSCLEGSDVRAKALAELSVYNLTFRLADLLGPCEIYTMCSGSA